MSDTFSNRVAAAREALEEQGDTDAAFQELRWVFYEVELAGDPERLAVALTVLAGITAQALGEEVAALVETAASNPDDPQALYNLGYNMIELGLPEVATCALVRANTLTPGQEAIVTELVAALERDGRNQTACQILRAAPDLCQQSFICRYLLAFNSLMSADLQTPRDLLPSLQQTRDAKEIHMAARIEAMLNRADLVQPCCALDGRDLRGWHFVTTGGLLLHLSPHGFDEGMNGRYAYVADTFELCHLGLRRLEAALEAWEESPPWILAPPDRDSQILAAAAEELLGLPVVEYTPDAGPGLVVAYDLTRIAEETPPEILLHSPGQLLYAHATCWTDPPRCAPDVTALLYQGLQTPWGERMQVSPEGEVTGIPEDTRSVEDLAADIVAAAPNDELEQVDPLDRLIEAAAVMSPAASFRNEAGRRSPLWEGGPVQSKRFV